MIPRAAKRPASPGMPVVLLEALPITVHARTTLLQRLRDRLRPPGASVIAVQDQLILHVALPTPVRVTVGAGFAAGVPAVSPTSGMARHAPTHSLARHSPGCGKDIPRPRSLIIRVTADSLLSTCRRPPWRTTQNGGNCTRLSPVCSPSC